MQSQPTDPSTSTSHAEADAPRRTPDLVAPPSPEASERPSRPPFERRGGPHLWEINVVRDLALVAAVAAALWLLVVLQAVVVPFVIAFVLAYLVDPIVSQAQERFGWSRTLTTSLILGVFIAAAAVTAGLLVPTVQSELRRLVTEGPAGLQALRDAYGDWLPAPPSFLGEPVPGPGPPSGDVADYAAILGEAFGVLREILGVTGYLLVATVLTLATFLWLSIRFPRLPSLRPFLPRSRRDQLAELIERIERVFAGFFRGQLVVAAFTTTVFAIGFTLSGVPYAFLVSLIGGAFSIIPYGQVSGFVLAVLTKLVEAQDASADLASTAVWVGILLGPTIVYAIMQSLETFVVTPWVQGSTTRMHPLLVFAAVIAGGSVGGVLGVFLAIPIAASANILLREVLLPGVRRLAERS